MDSSTLWLVTTSLDADLTALVRDLAGLGAEVLSDDAIPIGDDEQFIVVAGPGDLPERVRYVDLPILSLHPDSRVTPF